MEISVIIRTKNEEEWLGRTLHSLSLQTEKSEMIIVDNHSNDRTLNIAEKFGCKAVSIPPKEFTYGLALNRGIAVSSGKYLAILSAHCVPANERWLINLKKNFGNHKIAGVYGRQLPLPDSTPMDKRDLWNIYGLEKKIQKKDFFFHNANSMIRRDIWEKYPFDEKSKGVEDRIWAKEVISEGYYLAYEPDAPVYHFHGINQSNDEKRVNRVVKVIEMMY